MYHVSFFNLLTGAESPVSEKQEQINNVEYNETLKYKRIFLRKPPYLLIPSYSQLTFEYDPIGRIKKTILPLAQGETSPVVVTTAYNSAFETTETHSSGTSKRTVKNASGEVLYVEDFSSDGTGAKIGFCYDIAGNRIKKSDLNDGSLMSCPSSSAGVPTKDVSGRNQTYWSYDAFGKLK
ncbi:hypothetical protein LEP1GSC034_2740, partial [Leptospira interrogans str. 2003000735]